MFIYCGALTEARGHVQPATTRVVRRSLYEYRTVLNLSLINDFVIPLSVAFRLPEHRPTEPPRTGAAGVPQVRNSSWFLVGSKASTLCAKSVLFFTLAM